MACVFPAPGPVPSSTVSTVGTCEPLCPLRTEAPTFSGKSELLRGAGVTTDAEAKQGSPPRAGQVMWPLHCGSLTSWSRAVP